MLLGFVLLRLTPAAGSRRAGCAEHRLLAHMSHPVTSDSPPSPGFAGKQISVLVVDDDP
jgi:hypothetical protein